MSEQEKKEYLMRYREAEDEVARVQEELLLWQGRAKRTPGGWSMEPRGGTGEGFPACVERVAELQGALQTAVEYGTRLRRSISAAIAAMQSPRLRLLLQLRYVSGCTWAEIAQRMDYAQRQVHNLHHKALDELRFA